MVFRCVACVVFDECIVVPKSFYNPLRSFRLLRSLILLVRELLEGTVACQGQLEAGAVFHVKDLYSLPPPPADLFHLPLRSHRREAITSVITSA